MFAAFIHIGYKKPAKALGLRCFLTSFIFKICGQMFEPISILSTNDNYYFCCYFQLLIGDWGANGSTSDQREWAGPYKLLNHPTNTSLCCISIKQVLTLKSETNWDKATCFEWKCLGRELITDWWSRNVLQLQAIDYRLEDNSIFHLMRGPPLSIYLGYMLDLHPGFHPHISNFSIVNVKQ